MLYIKLMLSFMIKYSAFFSGETTTKVVFRRKFILTIFIKFIGINIILWDEP